MPKSTTHPKNEETAGSSVPLTEFIKNNIFVVLGGTLVTGFLAGMFMVNQFIVPPKEDRIKLLIDEVTKLKAANPTTLSTKSLNVPTCDGVEIGGTWPQRVAANQPFVVRGKAPKLKGLRLWLFASLRDGGPPYNPRAAVELLANDEWTITETGAKRGDAESKHYAVFVVGKDGEKLIRNYRSAMNGFMEEVQKEWPEGDREWSAIKGSLDWPGIVEVIDMVRCDPPLKVFR